MRATEPIHSPTPEDIMEYLDGEGTAASRGEIAAHLAGCADCRTIAGEQRALSEQARAWSVPAAPDSLRAPAGSAGGHVARALAFRRPARWILAGLTTAAAALLVVSLNQGRRGAPSASAVAIDSIAPATAAKGNRPVRVAGNAEGQSRVAPESSLAAQLPAVSGSPSSPQGFTQGPRTPAIIRTARLQIVVKQFDGARTSVEALVAAAGGYIDQMTVTGDSSAARTLRGTLRVPANRMADTLTRLRGMGEVVEDTQGSEDVTDQIVDLDARLASARATERRLTELLRDRTGRLSDVLEVERELTRVRLDIERLETEKANIGRRVSYATVGITISEARKAGLDGPLSLTTRLRVAAADGLATVIESGVAALLFVLRAGPTLVLWGAILWLAWSILRPLARFGIRDSR